MSQTQSLPAWKEEINAKLSAHRSRRGPVRERNEDQQTLLPGMDAAKSAPKSALGSAPKPASGGRPSSRIAAKVAERYAKAPSYSEMLAQEAAKAARAAAEAANQAHAAAQAMLQGMEFDWEQEDRHEAEAQQRQVRREPKDDEDAPRSRWEEMAEPLFEAQPEAPPQPVYRIHEDSLPPAPRTPAQAYSAGAQRRNEDAYLEREEPREAQDTHSYDRHSYDPHIYEDPVEAATIEPAQPLPARVIEFPRELVATRKARPRLEEGPLRLEDEQSQLRIFEVEPETISHEPVMEMILPEWHSIRLDSRPETAPVAAVANAEETAETVTGRLLDAPIYSASLEDRLMAGTVDVCLVGIGFLAFVATFVACTPHPPAGKFALAGAVAALLVLFVVYQFLFFSFAEGTPGMRYAKIALCTFDDDNPSRKAMRNRVVALMLAALPLGLGYLWPFFDEDRLGWHDRMTRTYQRSYREN